MSWNTILLYVSMFLADPAALPLTAFRPDDLLKPHELQHSLSWTATETGTYELCFNSGEDRFIVRKVGKDG